MGLAFIEWIPIQGDQPRAYQIMFWGTDESHRDFYESKQLWDTTLSTKTTKRAYVNLFLQIRSGKDIGVVYLFIVPIVRDNHG